MQRWLVFTAILAMVGCGHLSRTHAQSYPSPADQGTAKQGPRNVDGWRHLEQRWMRVAPQNSAQVSHRRGASIRYGRIDSHDFRGENNRIRSRSVGLLPKRTAS